MKRFLNYIILFLVNFSIWIISIFLGISDLVSLINFLCFVLCIYYFLFSVEEPPKSDKLFIPEVHNYYKDRINHFNNYAAIEFALLSLIFYLLMYVIQLNLGIVTFLLWGISIPITYILILITSSSKELINITDYIYKFMPQRNYNEIKELVRQFLDARSLDINKLKELEFKDKEFRDSAASYYILYVSTRDRTLTQDEIKEINDL